MAWVRLKPNNASCSMFELRDATNCELALGDRWGDDYLRLPDEIAARDLVLSLVELGGWGSEIVNKLPPHLSYLDD